MVEYSTQMLDIGAAAPEFTLPNVVDRTSIKLSEAKGNKGTMVFWACNHCPYVVNVREQFKPLADEYLPQGISFVAINSNSTQTHPQDGPEHMAALAKELNWPFPFLFDESQEVARSYGAACTPDFFLFDKDLKLYYRGQMDDSRPRNGKPVTGKDLRQAFKSLIGENPAPKHQQPSAGCSIKWHPEN